MSRADRGKRAKKRRAGVVRLIDRATVVKQQPHGAHWSVGEWRENLDAIVVDGPRREAFPLTYPVDLLGRIQVKLAAEHGDLVAYGFGGQRIVVPRESIGSVVAMNRFRLENGEQPVRNAVLVLDHERKILLLAVGPWDTGGDVARVCAAIGLPAPKHTNARGFTEVRQRDRPSEVDYRDDLRMPRYFKAPAYQRLRVRPRGYLLRGPAVLLAYAAGLAVGTVPGAVAMALLPGWLGAVRMLLALVVLFLGAAGGFWAAGAAPHGLTAALRWAAASWAAKAPAPAKPFFSRRHHARSRAWRSAADIGLAALCAALVGWGPGVGLAALAHGLQPVANVISAAACTLALPPLGFHLVRRWRRRRQPVIDSASDLIT